MQQKTYGLENNESIKKGFQISIIDGNVGLSPVPPPRESIKI